jgi:hypothetical protein
MSKWEVREVNKVGVKTLYQVCKDEEDGTVRTAGGHYEDKSIAQLLCNVMNKEA